MSRKKTYLPQSLSLRFSESFGLATWASPPLENSENLSDKEWGEYVFFRANPKGIFYERWVHTHGCRKWFNAVRDTSTDEILKIYKLNEKPPELKEFSNTLKSPSGEPKVGSGNFTVKK